MPHNIEKSISSLSSNVQIFNNAKSEYQEALMKSGFSNNMTFEKLPVGNNKQSSKNRKTRKRNVTWFNPPFSINVATNVGKNSYH